jgi:peptide/nickel transport system ATP-binding protein
MSAAEPLLQVDDLRTYFDTEKGLVRAVDGLSFQLNRGETLAVVGESGSGKSVMSLSIMRLVTWPGRIAGGSILLDGESLLEKSEREMQDIRGNRISMIFQEPMTSLNPVFTIGDQITETIALHQRKKPALARRQTIEMLDLVGIPEPAKRLDAYPHQLSGGMRQRVMIAMALACSPKLLIADEPTTALDVTVQAQILELMLKLQKDIGMSILFITHDLGVVAEIADRVVVMYAGRAVEEGSAEALFTEPRMPYTIGLLNSVPRVGGVAGRQARLEAIPGNVPNLIELPPGCAFHPRCRFASEVCQKELPELVDTGGSHSARCVKWRELSAPFRITVPPRVATHSRELAEPQRTLLAVKDLSVEFPIRGGLLSRAISSVKAVQSVSFDINAGEVVSLVGESGSGKTTIGRAILRLIKATRGTIQFDGSDISNFRGRELRQLARKMQIIFQDPYGSLNPRTRVGDIIGEALAIHKLERGARRRERVVELLENVGLSAEHIDRYPHEFSGGQRQRIGIARALAVSPRFVVADEPVSALDVSVQAQVINLLQDLKDRLGLTLLLIAHDLGVVEYLSDRVIVMYLGRIMEIAPAKRLYARPVHPYTEALLSGAPVPDPKAKRNRIILKGEIPSPINPPSGCVFRTRCPLAVEECARIVPPLVEVGPDHASACIRRP